MSLHIELPKRLEQFAAEQAARHQFASPDAYVMSLVEKAYLSEMPGPPPASKEEIIQMLKEADEDIEAGRCVEWKPGDSLKMFAEMLAEHQQKKSQ